MRLFQLFRRIPPTVFNDLLDSFHNTIAKAKEEREQRDRLLTISTPRERLLVTAIAVLLLVLGAWVFLGSIVHSQAVDGVLVGQGESSPGDGRSVQALVWIGRDTALQVKAGMPVEIELDVAEGGAGALSGTVRTISAVPFAGELAALESSSPVSVHRVEIALEEDFDLESLGSRECRIVIDFGKGSPIRLFSIRRT